MSKSASLFVLTMQREVRFGRGREMKNSRNIGNRNKENDVVFQSDEKQKNMQHFVSEAFEIIKS